MDDVFIERLVARKMGPKEMAIKALIALAVVVLLLVSMMISPIWVPLLVAVAVAGGWYLWTITNVEYEYSLVPPVPKRAVPFLCPGAGCSFRPQCRRTVVLAAAGREWVDSSDFRAGSKNGGCHPPLRSFQGSNRMVSP